MKRRNMRVFAFVTLFTMLCTSGMSLALATGPRPDYPLNVSNAYEIQEIFTETSHVEVPGNFLCRENDVLVTDIKRNRMISLDFEGNFVGEVGSLGSAPLEFMEPTGIALNEQYIFVLDSGNRRVQVLTHDLTHMQDLHLKRLALEFTSYLDISATKDGTLYFATDSPFPEDAFLYQIDFESTLKPVAAQAFIGSTYYHEGILYALDTGEVKGKKGEGYGFGPGHIGFYQFDPENKEFIELFRFDDDYGPTDFMIEEGLIYVLSANRSTLDVFDMKGKYLETIADFQFISPLRITHASFVKLPTGDFLVANGLEGRLFLIKKVP